MAIDIRPLDPYLLESAFDLATRVFIGGSTLHCALGIGLEEYRSYLRPDFEAMVCEGLSVAAIDTVNNELSGCLIVTDVTAQFRAQPVAGPAFTPLAKLNGELFSQYLRSREIRAGETVLVDMGAVSQDARGGGVYRAMRAAAQDLARRRRFRRVLGELSSSATQRFVLERLGHKKVAEVDFATFEFEGTRPFRTIIDPPSLVLAEGML